MLNKLKYYYINVSPDDVVAVEQYEDWEGMEDPCFRISIEGESGRFEIRQLELEDMKKWRDKLDAAIKLEESKSGADKASQVAIPTE